MSDSGVEFTSSGLPLDSDTDAAITYASHKPLLNAISPTAMTGGLHSDSLEATLAPHGDLSASRTPDSATSASPASNPRSLAAATPDGSLCGAALPEAASRGTTGSDSGKTEGGAENGESEQKADSAQSTWENTAHRCCVVVDLNNLALLYREPLNFHTPSRSLHLKQHHKWCHFRN